MPVCTGEHIAFTTIQPSYIKEDAMFKIYFVASCYVPTYAKRRQYIAAIIGPGIDAKRAPNFPTKAAQNHYHQIQLIIVRSTGA